MPQCCYLAKGAKRPNHTTNMQTFSNKSSFYILAVTTLKASILNSAAWDRIFILCCLNRPQIPELDPEKWTQPVFVKTAQDLISRMDDKRSKVFNAHQGNFGSQWLNVVPCKGVAVNRPNFSGRKDRGRTF